MAKQVTAGGSDRPTSGEILERRRHRRKLLIIAALGLVGGIIGGTIGAREGDQLFVLSHPWPPMLSLAAAATLLVAVIVGSVALTRELDEVEQLARLKGVKAGANVFLIGYPIWFLLWKGGFLPEPMHVALFFGTLIAMLLASLFYRLR
jgi:MFS family permease